MNRNLKFIFILLFIANILALMFIQKEKANITADIERCQINSNLNKIKVFKDSLPEEKDILTLIGQLTKLGNSLDLDIPGGIHYQPLKVNKNGYKNLVFTMAVAGEYRKIRKFIYNMETFRKLIYIESLSLRKTGSGNDNLVIDLQVTTYFK